MSATAPRSRRWRGGTSPASPVADDRSRRGGRGPDPGRGRRLGLRSVAGELLSAEAEQGEAARTYGGAADGGRNQRDLLQAAEARAVRALGQGGAGRLPVHGEGLALLLQPQNPRRGGGGGGTFLLAGPGRAGRQAGRGAVAVHGDEALRARRLPRLPGAAAAQDRGRAAAARGRAPP